MGHCRSPRPGDLASGCGNYGGRAFPRCYTARHAQSQNSGFVGSDMTARVVAGLRAVRHVAERTDPTVPLGTSEIAAALGASLSSTSRLCGELVGVGLLARGDDYGSYRLGPRAVRISGRAAAPFARAARYALTVAAQVTGETACLAARTGADVRILASVGSEWTLHASADVGELVDPRSAVVAAADGSGSEPAGSGGLRLFESKVGRRLEIASPVLNAAGERIAVVAVRLPLNRAARGVPRARRAVENARRSIEGLLAGERLAGSPPSGRAPRAVATVPHGSTPALEAAARLLDHLADGADTIAGAARATSLRPDRAQRILDSCRRAGMVRTDPGDSRHELRWGVHAWHRATTTPTLVRRGRPLVAAAARETGTYGFITVLRGIRSFTIVEELGDPDGGLVMLPWLGRPHPIIGSDGGPTLVMEFIPAELEPLLRRRHSDFELDELFSRVRRIAAEGVLSIEGIEESGLVSTSAPIRDASGAVAGAACLTSGSNLSKERVEEVKKASLALASHLTVLLGGKAT